MCIHSHIILKRVMVEWLIKFCLCLVCSTYVLHILIRSFHISWSAAHLLDYQAVSFFYKMVPNKIKIITFKSATLTTKSAFYNLNCILSYVWFFKLKSTLGTQ